MDAADDEDAHPSPFYLLVEDASAFTLVFEADAEGVGPFYAADGTLVPQPDGEEVEAAILARRTGQGRYRLCANEPFVIVNLHWGDEFLAEAGPDGRLRLTGVVAPLRFVHDMSALSGPLDPDGALSRLVHSLGGGWESYAGGLLTVTIPSEQWEAYESGLRAL